MGRGNWNPRTDIPDLSGMVILVTGGNSGLGRESILALAKHNPSRIYLAARDTSKGLWAIDIIERDVPKAQITLLECDLSSLSSVHAAAKKVASESNRLDILMCNAGVVACPKGLSKDGYEIQFATNHLGHALLIKLLLPLVRKTADSYGDARIVSLTSPGFGFSPKGGIQFNSLRSEQDLGFGGPPKRYGQSKLANILYADELARRNPQVTSVAIDPGAAKTELFTNQGWLMKTFITLSTWMRGEMMWSAEEGAYNQLWATTGKVDTNGGLYRPIGKRWEPTGHLKDGELRGMLWDWTESELKAYTL